MARIIESLLSIYDAHFDIGLYPETLDLRRIFVDVEGNAKAAFYSFVPNDNELLTLSQLRARYQVSDLESYNIEYEHLYESPTGSPTTKKPYVVTRIVSYCLGLAILEMGSLDNRFLYKTNQEKLDEALVIVNEKYQNPHFIEVINTLLKNEEEFA